MTKKNEKNIQHTLNIIYGIVFVLCLLKRTLSTTMWEIPWPSAVGVYLRWAVIFLVVARLLAFRKQLSFQTMCLEVVVIVPAVLCYVNVEKYAELMEFMLLIACAFGMEFRTLLKLYVVVETSVLVVTVACAQLGLVENLIYRQEGYSRISFGYIYPTDFTAHIFFLILAWILLREGRLHYLELCAMVTLSVGCYVFCHARTNTICILLAAVGAALLKRYLKRRGVTAGSRAKKTTLGERILFAIGLCINGFCCAFTVLLTYFYRADQPIMAKLNVLLSARLEIGHMGFEKYNVTLLAQKIKMTGFGGSTTAPDTYFYLDCSYVNMLLRYGLLVTVAVLVMFFVLAYRSIKARTYWMLFCIALLSVQCMIEHHMLALAYDPILFALFTAPWTNLQYRKNVRNQSLRRS